MLDSEAQFGTRPLLLRLISRSYQKEVVIESNHLLKILLCTLLVNLATVNSLSTIHLTIYVCSPYHAVL